MTDKQAIEQVGPVDPAKETSPIVTERCEETNADARTLCYYNGAAYSMNAEICAAGNRLYCQQNGTWMKHGSC